MAVIRHLQEDIRSLESRIAGVEAQQGYMARDLYRLMTRANVGLDRLLAHLGLTPTSDEDVVPALGTGEDGHDGGHDNEL